MYKPKSKCCNATIQVEIGDVERDISDQKYVCSKCGKECEIADKGKQEAKIK